jgi:hypothetical protein
MQRPANWRRPGDGRGPREAPLPAVQLHAEAGKALHRKLVLFAFICVHLRSFAVPNLAFFGWCGAGSGCQSGSEASGTANERK